jgi:hypothetical protein
MVRVLKAQRTIPSHSEIFVVSSHGHGDQAGGCRQLGVFSMDTDQESCAISSIMRRKSSL